MDGTGWRLPSEPRLVRTSRRNCHSSAPLLRRQAELLEGHLTRLAALGCRRASYSSRVAFVRRYIPQGEPIGRRISEILGPGNDRWTIADVIADVHTKGLDLAPA